MKCELFDLGLTDYGLASRIQSGLVAEVKQGVRGHCLLLAEFYPVYTIGRTGSPDNLLVSSQFLHEQGIGIVRVDRGGDITVHSPGQLIIYPIFNLALLTKDLHWFLRSLEEAAIRLLSCYGISGRRRDGLTGVWVHDEKIASAGIAVSRWVSYHGLSVNVNNDLSYFDAIYPCGMKGCRVTSLSELTGSSVDMQRLKSRFLDIVCEVFSLERRSHHDRGKITRIGQRCNNRNDFLLAL